MMPRRKPLANVRRSGSRQRRSQDILEVGVRKELANRQRNRKVLVWTCKLLILALLVSGSLYGGRQGLRRFLWENPEYNVAAIEITNDGAGLSREMILQTARLQTGVNIFSVSLAQVREAIAALPQVERVELQKVLPNKITINITERRPVAWLSASASEDPSASRKACLLDSKGVVFKPKRQVTEYLRLPVIYGVDPENFPPGGVVDNDDVLTALDLIRQNGDGVRFELQSIDISKGYCMVATDTRKAQYVFGPENISRQLERLGAVMDHCASNGGQEIHRVNLIPERNIPVTFVSQDAPAPDAAPEEKAEEKTEPVAAPPAKKEKLSKTSRSLAATRKSDDEAKRASFLSTRKKAQPEPAARRAEPVIRRAQPVRVLNPVAVLTPALIPNGQR